MVGLFCFNILGLSEFGNTALIMDFELEVVVHDRDNASNDGPKMAPLF